MREVATLEPEDTAQPATPPDEGDKKREARPGAERLSPTMKAIRDDEEKSLRLWLDEVGTQGAFKVQVRRTEPEYCNDPRSGARIKTKGFLGAFDHTIDESWLAREFGGGTYHLRVTRQDASGSFQYAKGLHRTVEIAGDPRLDRLPSNAPPLATPPASGENPQVVKTALDMMERMVERQGQDREPRGIDPGMDLALKSMRDQLADLRAGLRDRDEQLAKIRDQRPPEDTFQHKLLSQMVDGESARIISIRTQHESEIRALRDAHAAAIKLLEDRHDRAMEQAQRTADAALATIKTGFERELAAMRSFHETSAVAVKSSTEVQVAILGADIARLQRENDGLHREVKELREKKDKSILDMVTEVDKLKELLGAEETGGTAAKVVEVLTNPAAVKTLGESVRSVFGGTPATSAGQPGPGQQPAQPEQQKIVRTPDGTRYLQVGTQLREVKRKPKMIATDAGEQVAAPVVDKDQIKLLINYLEQSLGNNIDPEVVAQSGRAHIPPDVLSWIKAHDTEQCSGVDLFMRKVANLPGSSPLCSQRGKNWLRLVGKALVSD
jgi:hypothetical protein